VGCRRQVSVVKDKKLKDTETKKKYIYIYIYILVTCGPDSVVGIATDYWLDGTGIESR
jgi:hypothetical protein